MNPSARSKRILEAKGFMVAIVERWIQQARKRIDAFGFADLMAIIDGPKGVLAVQATTGSNFSAHITKILQLETVPVWLDAGNRIQVHGWRLAGARGKRKLWACRRVEIVFGFNGLAWKELEEWP